ncbi:hypothetical protein VTL71DRAFT_10860 [Oculimacula yallundae]|uniref:Uncharacterized protein n=1 Tax=Oculimacula yallundae TaxID=86028 RepID=A0ABR4CWT8_9HELO
MKNKNGAQIQKHIAESLRGTNKNRDAQTQKQIAQLCLRGLRNKRGIQTQKRIARLWNEEQEKGAYPETDCTTLLARDKDKNGGYIQKQIEQCCLRGMKNKKGAQTKSTLHAFEDSVREAFEHRLARQALISGTDRLPNPFFTVIAWTKIIIANTYICWVNTNY